MTTKPFANLTQGTKKGRLTERQASRLQNLLASGPLDYKPVDDELFILGWVQLYDGSDAVEGVDGAAQLLYNACGEIKDEWLPSEWKRTYSACCANGMEHQNCNRADCMCDCHTELSRAEVSK